MCGIAGIIGRNKDFFFHENELKVMSTHLKHRGPDDGGFLVSKDLLHFEPLGTDQTPEAVYKATYDWCPKRKLTDLDEKFRFGLLHQRLSIVDLSEAGHQPMRYKDHWITFNGEIYNYIELRKELEAKGYDFLTQTDTEVVLKAYDCWGDDFLQKLNGMWAFMLFNQSTKECFFARDRIGVKPFYYIDDASYFAFASEIKALHFLSFVDTTINQKHLFCYFANHEVEFDGNTLFAPIKELKPGHFLRFNLNEDKIETSSYFDLECKQSSGQINESEVLEETLRLLKHAVQLRMRSDVPVGFCLSGGIDSSSLVSVAANYFEPTNLKTFSALTLDEVTDEKKWIDKVLEKYKLDGNFVSCNSTDLIAGLEELIYHQDIPILTSSTYAQDSVMKLAKQKGVTVLIDGQGGDELFAGYIPFYTAQLHVYIVRLKWISAFRLLMNMKNSPYSRGELLKTYLKTLLNKCLPKSFLLKFIKNQRQDLHYFNPQIMQTYKEEIDFSRGYFLDEPNLVLKKYYQGNFLKNLLRWEDRCSMHYSIESRTPLSDDLPLMNYLFSLPFEPKIKGGVSKYLLRNAMDDILPIEVKNRIDKKGFSIPQYQWMLEQECFFKNIVENYVDPIQFIDKIKILKDWKVEFKNEKFQNFVFKYVCYLIWVKRFNMHS